MLRILTAALIVGPMQADAPITARESLRDSPDKKNPGEEGYGNLQGRATAAYTPHTPRSCPTPCWPHAKGLNDSVVTQSCVQAC